MKHVRIERNGRVATVTLDRGNAANALSLAAIRELTEAARSFEGDHETSAVILAGGANFTMGFDLRDAESEELRSLDLSERRQRLAAGPRMCQAWQDIEPLTIAAVEGWCIGGGVALAVACDFRIVGRSATLYAPEIERGMNMSWGSVPRTVALIGPARTKQLFILAERVGARRALDWGLVDEVAEDGAVLDAARRTAGRAAGLPPIQLRMIKELIDANAHALGRATSAIDRDQSILAQQSGDFEEGVRSFLEGREANFTGE